MQFAVYALTKHGAEKALKIVQGLPSAHLYLSKRVQSHIETCMQDLSPDEPLNCPEIRDLPLPMGDFLKEHFSKYDCHIFVISVGAVVRMVAPCMISKKVDPAVVCVDDDGKFAICTLSGHVGRGNSYTERVAEILGATPVVTTASDVRGTLTVDILGRDLGWTLEDPDLNVTKGCAAVVNEEPVAFVQESGEPHWWPLDKDLPPGVQYFKSFAELEASQSSRPQNFGIILVATDRLGSELDPKVKENAIVYHPKSLVLGIGCDRGTPVELLEAGVKELLQESGLALAAVARVATIDLKADEPGLLELCRRYSWQLVTYTAEELDGVTGTENPSLVVQKHTGTRGVAEPAALKSSGAQTLTVPKKKFTVPGVGRFMTLAVGRIPFEKRGERSLLREPVKELPQNELPIASPEPQEPPKSRFAISFEEAAPEPEPLVEPISSISVMDQPMGRLSLVGIGPGHADHISPKALEAIKEADIVVGYRTYMLLVRPLLKNKKTIKTGMTEEISRAQAAVEHAASGLKVALISSGDAGVYGMANLVFDVLRSRGWKVGMSPEIRMIPGITALNSCASLVGAPLGHDSCMISLSDLLTPWPVIERRIDAAAQSDFVIGLYNPASGRRQKQIVRAQEIIKKYRPGSTPVALVKSAYRFRQHVEQTTLDQMLDFEIGMLTTVLIGNSHTYVYEGFMVTPRGYHHKYSWDGAVKDGQTPGESLRL